LKHLQHIVPSIVYSISSCWIYRPNLLNHLSVHVVIKLGIDWVSSKSYEILLSSSKLKLWNNETHRNIWKIVIAKHFVFGFFIVFINLKFFNNFLEDRFCANLNNIDQFAKNFGNLDLSSVQFDYVAYEDKSAMAILFWAYCISNNIFATKELYEINVEIFRIYLFQLLVYIILLLLFRKSTK